MQYHIQTTPIWDSFKAACGCPLCTLYQTTESRFVAQYLGEAVMEPDYRVRVNKTGFCVRHLGALYAGTNKLGVSLQVHTRTTHIIDKIGLVHTAKAAKKQAAYLKDTLQGCVICEETGAILKRYAETLAQMFRYEQSFMQVLENSRGFCLPHYALLLETSHWAGPKTESYLLLLSKVQLTRMKQENDTLERFVNRFDYNSKEKYNTNTDDALRRSVNRLTGEIIPREDTNG